MSESSLGKNVINIQTDGQLALWTDTAGDADIEPDNQFVEPWDQDDVLFDNIESCLVFQNLNTVNTVMKKKEQLEQQQNTRLGRLRDRPRPISDFSEILCRIAKKHTVDDDDSDPDYRMHNRTIVEIIPGTAAGGSTANLDLPSKPGTSFHAQDMPLCFQNLAKRSSLVANGSSTDQRRSESAGAFRKMSVEFDALHQIKSSQQVSAAASKSIQEWRSQKAEAVLTMKRLKNVFPATNFRLPPPSHYYQVYDPKHSSSSSSFDKKQLIKDKNFWDDLTGERQKPNFQASVNFDLHLISC